VPLATTTDKAWTMQDYFNLNPQQQWAPRDLGKKTLAAIVDGELPGAFAGRPVPGVVDSVGKDGKIKYQVIPADASRTVLAKSPKTAIIIVGDSDFITDQNLRMFGYNMRFILNAIDYLTLDESLITIRTRGKADRPLKQISEAAKNTAKFINIFGMSILVVALALVRFYYRKKVKQAAAAARI
jgi:hypothetical protein